MVYFVIKYVNPPLLGKNIFTFALYSVRSNGFIQVQGEQSFTSVTLSSTRTSFTC